MIRKKHENQTSILLRIFTNYLQLVTASLSFNVNFPDTITDSFGPVDTIGSASDTFLSFDCFIEDAQMTGFAPSNGIFKVFLVMLLPIVLIVIFSMIWGVLFIVNKKLFGNIKKYITVSAICIVFLLHPTITKSTLDLFDCVDAGEGQSRMRLHVDFDCYSTDKLKWVSLVGIPNLIIWVFG